MWHHYHPISCMSLLSAVRITDVAEQWLDVNGGSYQHYISAVTIDLWPTIIQQHKYTNRNTQHVHSTSASAHKVVPVTALGLSALWLQEARWQLAELPHNSEWYRPTIHELVWSAQEKLPLQKKTDVIELEELVQCFGSYVHGCSALKPDLSSRHTTLKLTIRLCIEHIISSYEKWLLHSLCKLMHEAYSFLVKLISVLEALQTI